MPVLSETQLRVDKWSKCTLLGATLLFVYSLFVLIVSIHADRRYHHEQWEREHQQEQQAERHDMMRSWSQEKSVHKEKQQPQQQPEPAFHLAADAHANKDKQEQPAVRLQEPQQEAPPPRHSSGGFFHRDHKDKEEHKRNHHHGDRHHHGRRFGGPDGPCRLHHFAVLGLITSVTGMIASFTNRRGYALAFLILVLITEISALGYIGFQNARAVKMCSEAATSETIVFKAEAVQLSNGKPAEQVSVVGARVDVNRPFLDDCMQHVRHVSVLGSLIIGVIACALACCGSRFSNSLSEREGEELVEAEQEQVKKRIQDAIGGGVSFNADNNSCVVHGKTTDFDGDKEMTHHAPVVAVLVSPNTLGVQQHNKEQPQLFV